MREFTPKIPPLLAIEGIGGGFCFLAGMIRFPARHSRTISHSRRSLTTSLARRHYSLCAKSNYVNRSDIVSNIALQIERQAAGTVSANANVIFDTIVYSDGNVSYDASAGVITFNEAGRYVINWWVARPSRPLQWTAWCLRSRRRRAIFSKGTLQ